MADAPPPGATGPGVPRGRRCGRGRWWIRRGPARARLCRTARRGRRVRARRGRPGAPSGPGAGVVGRSIPGGPTRDAHTPADRSLGPGRTDARRAHSRRPGARSQLDLRATHTLPPTGRSISGGPARDAHTPAGPGTGPRPNVRYGRDTMIKEPLRTDRTFTRRAATP